MAEGTDTGGGAPGPGGGDMRALWMALGLCTLIKLPSLWAPHGEVDERIFLELARSLLERGSYSLQGRPILGELSSAIYDRPLFHHPPLYAGLLALFMAAKAPGLGILVSWAGHAMVVLAAWLLLRRAVSNAMRPEVLLPLLAVAVDPVLNLCGNRYWSDGLLAGLTALCAALFVLGLDETARARRGLWLGSGACLGLALLTKAPAALMLLPIAGVVLMRGGAARRALPALGWIVLPAALLVAPWLLHFRAEYGMWLPDWTRPDAAMMERSSFVLHAVQRPPAFYVIRLVHLTPLCLLVAGLLLMPPRGERPAPTAGAGVRRTFAAMWLVGVLLVFTLLGLWGQGYQMRFVAFAMAPLYLLLGVGLERHGPRAPALRIAVGVGVLHSLGTVLAHATEPRMVDAYSLLQLLARAAGG